MLNLVYNPQGPSLPPPQEALEADYKRVLGERYGIVFNQLFTLANMPIQRFGAILIAKGEFDRYLDLLQHAHLDANLDHVMCRNLISVDWQGYVYDCDFNQMLDLPLAHDGRERAAPGGPARRGARRTADPRRRPLLRLHRRPGIELRRRAEGSRGVNRRHTPAASARADYRYPPSVFDRAPEFAADVLYVVGGLYGNLAALTEVERLAADEGAQIVFNGDFHWFDAEPGWFAEIERRVARQSRNARQRRDRDRARERHRCGLRLRLSRLGRRGRGAPLERDPDRAAPGRRHASGRRSTSGRAADAPRRRGRWVADRHRAWRRERARRLVVRAR